MDLSALQQEASRLEASLDSIESWLFISTLAVVIGLVIEYWFPLRDLLQELKHPPFPGRLYSRLWEGCWLRSAFLANSGSNPKQPKLRLRSVKIAKFFQPMLLVSATGHVKDDYKRSNGSVGATRGTDWSSRIDGIAYV
jgi:hypothetical protein